MDVVTESGTIVMPTQTAEYSDPAGWSDPPVPREWWQPIRETMPAYDPRITPSRRMGRIVETFRTWPGTFRSAHAQVSLAARGKNAGYIVTDHQLDYSLGENSPLARVYELNGWVLLLGVGYESNTSFHLAEYRAPGARKARAGAPVFEDGTRVWKMFEDIELDAGIFPRIGTGFEQTGHARVSKVGSAEARLFSQREAVDFAERWLTDYREQTAEC